MRIENTGLRKVALEIKADVPFSSRGFDTRQLHQ